MHLAAPVQLDHRLCRPHRPGAGGAWRWTPPAARLARIAVLLLVLLAGASPGVRAGPPELTVFDVYRDEEGVHLNYAVDFELSRSVEDALRKAVPLFFVAEVQIFRDRWYWTDRRVAEAVRVWRVVHQPLTSSYRVTFGGLSQTYASSAEALAAISRGTRWKIAEPGQVSPDSGHTVEFSFRLDTNLLPRPMQIGVGGQPDWQLSLKRTMRLN